MKSFIKLFSVFSFVVLLFSACNVPKLSPLDDDIYIRFRDINFSGDWSHFADINVDSMEITLHENIYMDKDDAIKLKEEITYEDNLPTLLHLDTENPIVFPGKREARLESVKTTFFRGENKGQTEEDTSISHTLRRGTINDIALTYDMRTEAQIDFSAKITNNETAIVDSNEDGFYNFDVEVKRVKESKFDIPNSINFVVMAEGYRVDEMHYFRSYVEDAFANYGNFHYTKQRNPAEEHIPNDFFKEWWDYINVFAFETVSLHSGIDSQPVFNYVASFFDLNSMVELQFSADRMTKVIDINGYKRDLSRKDVDVYILFVNNPDIWAYSFSHVIRLGSRNKQPVTVVVIQAPAGRDVNSEDFHSINIDSDDHDEGVITDAIAHELGHALAQLQDEYKVDSSRPPYLPVLRNLSEDGYGNYIWQEFIDYDNNYFDNSPDPMPYNNNKLVNIKHSDYWKREYYIPTMNSTMRGGSGYESSYNYQYGPVNTYFMEGSFMIRMGMLPPENPGDIFGGSKYYWDGYSIADFHKRWPPSRFE